MELPVYSVHARNTSANSDNKIHDDQVAASYGFRGGLVPGVTVYAYMTVPLVERFGVEWLSTGSMQVKFHLPFYEGENVIVRSNAELDSEASRVAVTAEREDGTVCATAMATIGDRSNWLGEPSLEAIPEKGAPATDERPPAISEVMIPGTLLGTLYQRIESSESVLASLDERLPIYAGPDPIAHPFVLLSLSNQVVMHNFKLGPWIHAASDLINWSKARTGELFSVRARIREAFEKKGHEFVVLDVLLAAGDRVVQQVRHTAIYRPRVTSQT